MLLLLSSGAVEAFVRLCVCASSPEGRCSHNAPPSFHFPRRHDQGWSLSLAPASGHGCTQKHSAIGGFEQLWQILDDINHSILLNNLSIS